MNVYRDSVIPFTQFGGLSMSSEFSNFNRDEDWITTFIGQGGFSKQTSLPDGNYPPIIWRLPLKAGAITSRYRLSGECSLVYNGVLGYPASIDIIGTGTINNAEGSLLAYLISTLIGSGTLSGDTVGGLLILLDLVGSGILDGTLSDGITREDILADLVGQGLLTSDIAGGVSLSSDFIGNADLVGALGALAGAVCDIISSGELSGSISAKGFLYADITPFTSLSPESLAASVWNSVAAQFNNSGTMGNKLNSAGSAGDPWGTDLSTYTTPGTAGKKLKDGLTVGKFIALK